MTVRLSAVVLAIGLEACARPPTKELAIASERVAKAAEADAASFAPELLAEAEDALSQAETLQNTDRSYRAAIRAAAQASLRADEAFAKATAERRLVAVRLSRLTDEIAGLLEMAASRGASKEAASELKALRLRHDRIQASDNILEAYDEGLRLKSEVLALEQRFRDAERPR